MENDPQEIPYIPDKSKPVVWWEGSPLQRSVSRVVFNSIVLIQKVKKSIFLSLAQTYRSDSLWGDRRKYILNKILHDFMEIPTLDTEVILILLPQESSKRHAPIQKSTTTSSKLKRVTGMKKPTRNLLQKN